MKGFQKMCDLLTYLLTDRQTCGQSGLIYFIKGLLLIYGTLL